MTRYRAACIQVSAQDIEADNLETAAILARRARDGGAALIAFPENVARMSFGGSAVRAAAHPEGDHPALRGFCALARELTAHLLVGSLHVALVGEERVANRSYLIGPQGQVIAHYDKIHMFDVDLAAGESYRESRTFRPGDRAVAADSPLGRFGLSICYDLRFPHLYRAYGRAGAQILTVPAAFTRTTGDAHWHSLLRARAIENGCYVIAPAQCGHHPGDRETFGHSLIVDPWGRVLADGGSEIGIAMAEIDLARVTEARAMIPSLANERRFDGPA